MVAGIYKITNPFNGKFYIGSAVDCEKRWTRNYNKILTNAFKKYGKENFQFEIIEKIENKNILLEREQFFLDKLEPWKREIGYNIRKKAESNLGVVFTEKWKRNLSESHKGYKWTESQREKQSINQRGKNAGDKCGTSKLTWADVDEIRKRAKTEKQKDLAQEFGIASSNISKIVNGLRWREEFRNVR